MDPPNPCRGGGWGGWEWFVVGSGTLPQFPCWEVGAAESQRLTINLAKQ